MTGGRGHPPGRALTELELECLRLLLEIRERYRRDTVLYDELLENFVLRCRESGASARGMAEALDVGGTTIQNWTMNARRRRKRNRG